MADMDELFGSDGDSDNEQRGNETSPPASWCRELLPVSGLFSDHNQK